MLYNPKWEQQDLVYHGVSRRAFIAWLETMPADGRYDYTDPVGCALGQFAGRMISLSPRPEHAGYWLFKIVHTRPWTYEAALERAHESTSNHD